MPGFGQELNRNALASYMRHNYIPAPQSIYAGIAKLPPGTWIEFTADDTRSRRMPEPRVYWSARDAADTAARSLLAFESDAQAVDALEGVLSKAVGGQMLSDVSLGAFLSGGIDSSTIVALMQAQSAPSPCAPSPSASTKRATTRRSTPRLSPPTWAPTIPSCTSPPRMRWRWCRLLADMYDEPFADSSQIPTSLVTKMARQHVTVALSGDGGDELFGGYSRYFRVNNWWRNASACPLSCAIRPAPC